MKSLRVYPNHQSFLNNPPTKKINISACENIPEVHYGLKLYDAKIEYLESTGTQYINSGYRLWTSSITIETEMAFTDLTVNRSIEGAADAFYYGINNQRYETAYQNYWGTTDTNFHTFKKTLTKSSNKFIAQTWIDGISRYNSTSTSINTAIRSYITLFGTSSSSEVGENFSVAGYLKCRKISFKLIIDEEVVRDMIPVRKGNIGYMYDKVSGQLFGNSGTGSFTLGPDI